MKVAPVGKFAKQRKLSHDVIVADRSFRILVRCLSETREKKPDPKPDEEVRAQAVWKQR
jgi:hypothetical protein